MSTPDTTKPQDSESTQFLLLRRLIDSVNNADSYQSLINSGFTSEHLARISAMEITQLNKLCELLALNPLEFFIDPIVLDQCLESIESPKNHDPICHYFIKNGAPPQLVKTLFGLTRAEINRLRTELNIKPVVGRPQLPSQSIRGDIERDWYFLEDSGNTLQIQYHELHKKYPAYSIAALHTVVMESSII